MQTVGFKSMAVRILDGGQAVEGTNLFTIKGEKGKGATATANISGLSSEAVKTFGSDGVYHTNAKGVGDVKVEFGVIDLPLEAETKILGRKVADGLTYIGNSTDAPLVSVTLFSETTKGEPVAIGFFAGKFSKESMNLETKTAAKKELEPTNLVFNAEASTEEASMGEYVVVGIGQESVNKVKSKTSISVG